MTFKQNNEKQKQNSNGREREREREKASDNLSNKSAKQNEQTCEYGRKTHSRTNTLSFLFRFVFYFDKQFLKF